MWVCSIYNNILLYPFFIISTYRCFPDSSGLMMAQYKDLLTSSITHQYWCRLRALWPSISDLKFSVFAYGALRGTPRPEWTHMDIKCMKYTLLTNLSFHTDANYLNKQIQVQFRLLFWLKNIQYLCIPPPSSPFPLKKFICCVSLVFFCILYFTRTQLNLGCWVTERRLVKGKERETREKEKELCRWWALQQLRATEPFQLAHNCSPATEALLSIRIFPLSLPLF